MSQGPLGVNRPLVTTNLKYDVAVTMEQALYSDEERKAIDIVDKRVNAPQAPFARWLKEEIGKVLMATNSLAHPSSFRVVNEDTDVFSPGMSPSERNTLYASEGEVEINWTYIMQGRGMGEFANTSTTSGRVVKMHRVLIEGDNTPIENSQAIREFDSGPAEVHRVGISTD